MHFEKFQHTAKKTKKKNLPPVGRLLEHNGRTATEYRDDRERGNENIDPTRTHLNYDLAAELRGGRTAQQVYAEKLKGAQEKYEADNGKGMRKDTVTLCSWVVTAPQDLPPEVQEQFFEHVFEWLSNRYGKDNVIQATVHRDETTDHIHFEFMPFVDDKEHGGKKLCAKDLETPTKLKRVHVDLQKYLCDKLECSVNLLNGATVGGNQTIAELKLAELQSKLAEKEAELAEKDAQLAEKDAQLTELQDQALMYEQPPKKPLESNKAYEERAAVARQAVAVLQRSQAIDKEVNERAEERARELVSVRDKERADRAERERLDAVQRAREAERKAKEGKEEMLAELYATQNENEALTPVLIDYHKRLFGEERTTKEIVAAWKKEQRAARKLLGKSGGSRQDYNG